MLCEARPYGSIHNLIFTVVKTAISVLWGWGWDGGGMCISMLVLCLFCSIGNFYSSEKYSNIRDVKLCRI